MFWSQSKPTRFTWWFNFIKAVLLWSVYSYWMYQDDSKLYYLIIPGVIILVGASIAFFKPSLANIAESLIEEPIKTSDYVKWWASFFVMYTIFISIAVYSHNTVKGIINNPELVLAQTKAQYYFIYIISCDAVIMGLLALMFPKKFVQWFGK